MPPPGRYVKQRPDHERTLGDPGMGQHQPGQTPAAPMGGGSGPIHDDAATIDQIEIQDARAPWPAAPASRLDLDGFEAVADRRRRQDRAAHHDAVHKIGLGPVARRCRAIPRGPPYDTEPGAAQFLQRALKGRARRTPGTRKISPQTDKDHGPAAPSWKVCLMVPGHIYLIMILDRRIEQ